MHGIIKCCKNSPSLRLLLSLLMADDDDDDDADDAVVCMQSVVR